MSRSGGYRSEPRRSGDPHPRPPAGSPQPPAVGGSALAPLPAASTCPPRRVSLPPSPPLPAPLGAPGRRQPPDPSVPRKAPRSREALGGQPSIPASAWAGPVSTCRLGDGSPCGRFQLPDSHQLRDLCSAGGGHLSQAVAGAFAQLQVSSSWVCVLCHLGLESCKTCLSQQQRSLWVKPQNESKSHSCSFHLVSEWMEEGEEHAFGASALFPMGACPGPALFERLTATRSRLHFDACVWM